MWCERLLRLELVTQQGHFAFNLILIVTVEEVSFGFGWLLLITQYRQGSSG